MGSPLINLIYSFRCRTVCHRGIVRSLLGFAIWIVAGITEACGSWSFGDRIVGSQFNLILRIGFAMRASKFRPKRWPIFYISLSRLCSDQTLSRPGLLLPSTVDIHALAHDPSNWLPRVGLSLVSPAARVFGLRSLTSLSVSMLCSVPSVSAFLVLFGLEKMAFGHGLSSAV